MAEMPRGMRIPRKFLRMRNFGPPGKFRCQRSTLIWKRCVALFLRGLPDGGTPAGGREARVSH